MREVNNFFEITAEEGEFTLSDRVIKLEDINPVIKLFVRFGVFDVFVIEERSNAIFG